jgi:hypothetical protein
MWFNANGMNRIVEEEAMGLQDRLSLPNFATLASLRM